MSTAARGGRFEASAHGIQVVQTCGASVDLDDWASDLPNTERSARPVRLRNLGEGRTAAVTPEILPVTRQPIPQFSALSAALECETGSAYLLSLDLRIIYVNEGWRRFARENGAPALATSFEAIAPITEICGEPLRAFYRNGFSRVRALREPWSQLYECSSLSRYRKLSMRVDMTPERDGFVVVHSTVADIPSERASLNTASFEAYTGSSGLIVQCSNCRRARRGSDGDTWDWLPQLVTTRPHNVSHGLCRSCEVLYY